MLRGSTVFFHFPDNRLFDVFVDVIDVFMDLEGINRIRENEHDADIDKRHPEIAREEPSGDESEQHYDSREDEVFNDISYFSLIHFRGCL